ncbi:MAG: sugar transferase, partial [Candidatus Paceibacterota bacterium]
MKINTSVEPIFLLGGDILVLITALWTALFLRRFNLPSFEDLESHLSAFVFIFVIWTLVYFIYDLYSNQTAILQQKLSTLLFNAHIVNSAIALAFFYLIPFFAITPKTNLFIFLGVSFIFLLLWRKYVVFWLGQKNKEHVLFACAGAEVDEILTEFKNNSFYNIEVLDPQKVTEKEIKMLKPLIVINTHDYSTNEVMSGFYQMLFSGGRFLAVESLYESMFGRIPTSLISERWFLESVSLSEKSIYDFLKRIMDFSLALILGFVSLIVYPVVYLAIKLEDKGEVFIKPVRVGRNNKQVVLYKFRTM